MVYLCLFLSLESAFKLIKLARQVKVPENSFILVKKFTVEDDFILDCQQRETLTNSLASAKVTWQSLRLLEGGRAKDYSEGLKFDPIEEC